MKRPLRTNQYEEWAFEILRAKPRDKASPNRAKTSIGLAYIHGTSEKLARSFRAHDVGVYHRPINTIRSLLVRPKDKTPDLQKCGAIIILVLPPGVVCSLNGALPMLGTADGDAVSRCQVLGRAGSVHHGADQ